MTDKELKKLRRSDLLRLLVEQSRQMETVRAEAADTEDKLRAENRQLREQLERRELKCSESGSLADAAVNLSGVMEAAQRAADEYLDNIRLRTADQDRWLREMEAQSKARAEQMVADAERECAGKRAATERECAEQKAKTEELCRNATNEAFEKIDAYWNGLSSRLNSFYEAHAGLQRLLQSGDMEPNFTSGTMQAVLMGNGCMQ